MNPPLPPGDEPHGDGDARPAILGSPIGSIIAWAGSQAPDKLPTGYLPCNGQSLKRKGQYKLLFEAIGTAWGGDAVDNFNVPDLRGRFLRGVSADSGRDPDADGRQASNPGGHTGNEVGSVQEDAFQLHAHAASVDRKNIDGTNDTHDADGGDEKWNADPREGSITVTVKEPTQLGNRPPQVSEETRPLNAYVHYLIKAF